MKYPMCLLVCMLTLILAGTITTPAQEQPPLIHGGIVNGKATKLPQPEYPEELRIAEIGGRVTVQILIDEEGNVASAEHYIDPDTTTKSPKGESPHPLLVEAAREAALQAKFSPTVLGGKPARISGFLVYNFSKSFPVKDTEVAKQDPIESMGKSGVLNGSAASLPAPFYPPSAKAVRASGSVTVEVVIDEAGSVQSARAILGHPLLKPSAVAAARNAKFSPAYDNGVPVKISGVIVYNFVLPSENR
ncbi:MAG TPA: energy transducer TonB [Pyrinomonadaceae bacterium]|nr:energy transducer TonB [Pyrinomonadaceae bacterium]